ncbi:uncharacterized protein LOC126744845 [Anthonomus grandis grandis]|uniref:uncharacterized protein LOC126744845 n=1 Tax=Anthonomus grandis grandis TaxID=2921223 RepID=UPI00216627CE|nr:uncharacterized protein LOC126744845 [Anthonomus grandis grandis]XP_050308361.1 uncharacterized protein LOC126744845 [Anthonomus grandis grandis]
MDIVPKFNLIKSWNDQTAYLTGLISLCPVAQRRPQLPEDESVLRTSTFYYKVRIVRENVAVEERVCKNAFVSLHGLTRRRIKTIQKSLQKSGTAPIDKRGRHLNRKHKLSVETKNKILEHNKSFKTRLSHYSLNKIKRIYLSAELNVKKMCDMFKEKFPQVKASYETNRSIFCSKFNISFGYPRSDTCSFCDQLKVQIDACHEEKGIKDLIIQQKLHLAKAEVFYARKKQARLRSRTKADTEAICMDFGRNLPMPNLSTNDVYYSRQLSLFSFIVHKLSNSEVFFYAYPETVEKKGANEFCSFFVHTSNPAIKITKEHPRLVFHRDTYIGLWNSSVIVPPRKKRITGPPLPDGQFYHPPVATFDDTPIPLEKYKDLQNFKKFCTPESQLFILI